MDITGKGGDKNSYGHNWKIPRTVMVITVGVTKDGKLYLYNLQGYWVENCSSYVKKMLTTI